MWGWLKPLVAAILEWLEKRATQPKTLEDAQTPQTLRDRWASYLRDKLRDKNGGNKPQ